MDRHKTPTDLGAAARQLAAAEAALAELAAEPAPHSGLVAAALRLAHSADDVLGHPSGDLRECLLRRFGASLLAVPELPSTSDAIAQLRQAGYVAVEATPDPLSADPRTDVPSMDSSVRVPATAGIGGVRVPLALSASWPVLSAEVDVAVDLSASSRGAHMSRLQQAVVRAGEAVHPDVVAFALALSELVAGGQPCDGARIAVTVDQQPKVRSAVTGHKSSVDLRTTVAIDTDGLSARRVAVGVTAQVMTACPCTITFSRLASERAAGRPYGPEMPPTFTHSQPGELRVEVEADGAAATSPGDLLAAIRASATLREAVLKRPDEHDLVERAHRRPQFTEDLARDAVAAVAARVPAQALVSATASLAESIHPHRATASVRALAGTLWAGQR